MTYIALGTAGEVDGETAAFAARCLSTTFGLDVTRMDPLPEPAYAFDAKRKQYSSTLILREAVAHAPARAAKVLLLTDVDLFIPMLSFVYGQAQLDGLGAVVSTARLRQEFYGLPANRSLMLLRLQKEALHEVGHAFGLTHCEERLCTMALSTGLQQLDTKGAGFCEGCEVLLHQATAAARALPIAT